jgi:A-macroglobulin complement component/alpha-2-macroglobulin family protein/MG2 domain-containing protein/carboxypeptidase family protein/A-macroglobulin receptor/macroglobulin-like protein
MSRKWLLFLFCLALTILLTPLSRAALTLRIDESAIQILFEEQGTRVVLPIENSLGRVTEAHLKIEIIDTDNASVATAERDFEIKAGPSEATVPITLSLRDRKNDTRELLWYRLRYSVAPVAAADFDRLSNVVSLSQITPDFFDVSVATPPKAHAGSLYRLRVRTAHPLTFKPVAGIGIAAQMKFDGTDRPNAVLQQGARTDVSGFATIDLQIPRDVEDDEGEITVVATRGLLSETATADVEIDRSAQVLVSTDKPLYQPGQTLHARVLMFDASRHAIAATKATVKISDPESTAVFRAEINSSRFGVGNLDWPIPENTRLGDYSLEVRLDDDKFKDAYGGATVKISRYDLPNFTVNIKPDHAYYLTGQNAEVEVRGDYLFGQPVKHGHVRVVRETERHWDYREQKWQTDEGDKYEGDVDADGKFVAHVKLGEEHDKLKDEDYARYADLTYAAYFTDPSTNRTEQRRFDLRITKDAIHIYVISRARQAPDFPIEFYISAAYADGTPATCEVAVSRVWDEGEARPEVPLRTIKTDRYGLAKLAGVVLPKDAYDDKNLSLMFRARDNRGGSGKHTESWDFSRDAVVRISTDKPLYRDGEAIRAEITSNQSDLTLALDAIAEERVLKSQLVHLQNGRASVTVPYRREFAGAITLAAYGLQLDRYNDDAVSGTRTVLYPHDRDLKLQLALNQDSYRPGEEATASFLTRAAAGRAMESALGVVIFDKAVEERARTDRDFNSNYGFYRVYSYLTGGDAQVAGVTRQDLDRIDLSKPLPEGLDLVAEVLLTNYGFEPRFFHNREKTASAETAFDDFFHFQIDPLKDGLESEYKQNCDYPRGEAALRRLAQVSGIAFQDLRDPWETAYRYRFLAEGASDVLEMTSAGADKRFDTPDDFTVMRIERPYFRFAGQAIDRAVQRYHMRTGEFIRDAATMKNELRQEGIDFDELRDPWGEPYQLEFGVNQTKFQVLVRSSGPDKKFSKKSEDDVLLWTSSIDYSRDVRATIDAALVSYFNRTSQFPQNDSDLNVALQNSSISRGELRDPWGRPYYATFQQTAVYGNRVTIYSYANYGEKPKDKTVLTPVTQQMNFIYLRSDGEDGKSGTNDDFSVASFSRLITEQAGNESRPQQVKPSVILPGSTGAITGTLTDPNGAAVAGAKVIATNLRTELEYTAETSDDGTYIVKNLPAGTYQVAFDAQGFKRAVITQVIVRSSNLTRVDAAVEVGTVSETVAVTASGERTLQMTADAAMASTVVTRNVPGQLPRVPVNQTSTPRLREYFPETLVWQPSLVTDKRGRAQLKFKLADNITTWKMTVIGSTEDGQVGAVEKEITAFQPFFVEHDPPRILTEGDEISLPVVVRNYLDRRQTVDLQIKPENWFTLLGSANQNLVVPAGDSTQGTFDLRATAAVKDGKQRITANAGDANDAIEKPVTVHPDGEEKSVTASDIVSDGGTVTLEIPGTAIPNSAQAELKIYPNLLAHVAESVEAIMERPHGCGEQTISSTYPSLLLLRNFQKTKQDSPLRGKAERYLNAGYSRLLNYRDESGGFTYWGRGEPDLALTAYALRFLSEASELIPIDEDVIKHTRAWLLKQQRADGSWAVFDYDGKTEDRKRTAMLTAYVARVIAMTAEKPKSDAQISLELKRAFDCLSARVEEIDEPYLLASYVLARLELKDSAGAQQAIGKLLTLAHEENGGSYWSLETNTPFYGWGLAGRIETTALVVEALARYESRAGALATGSSRVNANQRPPLATDQLINRGLLFLLREKDRYGVWYSTQATINVLDALLSLLAREVGANSGVSRTAVITVNGRNVKSIDTLESQRLANPTTIDISEFLRSGVNQIQIRRAHGSAPASVQAVATYYLPWSESVATQEANWRSNGASGLRLVTRFDKTESHISDQINCHVEAERIGFRAYGMMLAEIGLPPGADVDRASLETAMKKSDWSISQYDILPDRVVLYLWPRAGGTKFDFKFRPRFGLKAQSAASIVYDYYNPEARAIVAPEKFVVR